MQATDDLRSEHRGILRMCWILEGIARDAQTGQAPSHEDLDRVLDFLTGFVDRCHHHKEERLLFPTVESVASDDVRGQIARLLGEHDEGRALVGKLRAGASEEASSELSEAALAYAALLRGHIDVEEAKLFSAADELLPPTEQARLADGYDRIEEEVVGAGKHEAFHVMLEEMEARYALQA